jgi:hypothetical protein
LGATVLEGEWEMATTATTWTPTSDEVRRIVAELRPVIDECVNRANRLLASAAARPEPVS